MTKINVLDNIYVYMPLFSQVCLPL